MFSITFQKDFLKTVEDKLKQADVPFDRLSKDQYSILSLHLSRPAIYKSVIKEVLTEGKLYGNQVLQKPERARVCVNNRFMYSYHLAQNSAESTVPDISLVFLRSTVIQEHLCNLLTANG